MSPRRTLTAVSIVCVSVLAACEGGAKPVASGSGAATGTAAPAPVVDAAPAAAAIDVAYPLPASTASKPLPASPAAFVFVAANASLRAGKTGSFAAATEVPDLSGLAPHLPPSAAPSPHEGLLGDPDAGFGFGRTGFGPGGGPRAGGTIGIGGYGSPGPGRGMGSMRFALATRGDPSSARVVVIADHGVPIRPLVDVLTTIGEPVALAVATDSGAAALGMLVGPRSPGWPTDTAPLELVDEDPLTMLVTSLDARASGTRNVAMVVRPRDASPTGPQVRIGQPQTVGDLDKAIIRRYIKRNIQKITSCYEKRLLVVASLQGTVQTEFVISPQGLVVSSKAVGLDAEVASCVAAVIKQIEFPKPSGGGIVKVNYPFMFRPNSY